MLSGIFICPASRIGCAMVCGAIKGELIRPAEMRMKIGALISDVHFGGEAIMATGCDCNETTLRLPGNILQINRFLEERPNSD